jgi:hypothetical protein
MKELVPLIRSLGLPPLHARGGDDRWEPLLLQKTLELFRRFPGSLFGEEVTGV